MKESACEQALPRPGRGLCGGAQSCLERGQGQLPSARCSSQPRARTSLAQRRHSADVRVPAPNLHTPVGFSQALLPALSGAACAHLFPRSTGAQPGLHWNHLGLLNMPTTPTQQTRQGRVSARVDGLCFLNTVLPQGFSPNNSMD